MESSGDPPANQERILELLRQSMTWRDETDDELVSALERACEACGIVPAATSLAEFDRRLAELVELTPEDEAGFLCDDEIEQLVIERRQVAEVRTALAAVVADELPGPPILLELYEQHLAANDEVWDHDEIARGSAPGLPPILAGILRGYRFVVVDDVGPGVTAVLFTGHHLNSAIVDRTKLPDTVEQTFLIYHMVMHVLFGHVRHDVMDFRFEFERGSDPKGLRSQPGYIAQEEDADDAATCLFSGAFADESFLHSAAARSWNSTLIRKETIREALRHRHKLVHRVADALRAVTPPRLHGLVDLPTKYSGAMGIVTAEGHPLYLLQRAEVDGESHTFRRWIPSRNVLRALGAENLPTDVVIKHREELESYDEGPMLINPHEVAAARNYLLATVEQSAAGSRLPSDRLAGLRSAEAVPPTGLWPEADYPLELPDLEALSCPA